MDALSFLDKAGTAKRQPVYVLLGDEDFLKRHCRNAILKIVLKEADPTFAVAEYVGDKLDYSTVHNDLETLPFLAPARIVMIENADPFVTAHRETLEKYLAAPSKAGVLVLDVKTFPETTKLAKALPEAAKIACKAPAPFKLAAWCVGWAKATHGRKLASDAANLLLERVGPQMGLLAGEIDKLATAIRGNAISAADVAALVGRSRDANVFHILDKIGEGKPQDALAILNDLFEDGEDPLAVLGPLTSQLRKLAAFERHLAFGRSIADAMDAAGVPAWPAARTSFDKQVRHLGRGRLAKLPDWLVEINLGVKGGNALPPRLQVERLIVKLARPR